MSTPDPTMRCPGTNAACSHYKFWDSAGSDGCRTRCRRTGDALFAQPLVAQNDSNSGPLLALGAISAVILAAAAWAIM